MTERSLTHCELEVMEVVWNRGQATVQDVVDGLDRPLAYTTVMTTMKILDRKGILKRCGKTGRAYIYEPDGPAGGHPADDDRRTGRPSVWRIGEIARAQSARSLLDEPRRR